MATITFKLEMNATANREGKHALYLRITHRRKLKRVALGHTIEKKYWKKQADGKGYYLSRGAPNYAIIQHEIEMKKLETQQFAMDRRNDVNTVELQKKLRGEDSGNFFEFANRMAEDCRAENRINTWKRYQTAIAKFRRFLKTGNVRFSDITVRMLHEYAAYLRQRGNAVSTIYQNNIKTIKAIYNQAVREEVTPMEGNPFLRFPLKNQIAVKEKLTEQEIQRIIDAPLEKGSAVWHTRNFFMFSFYCAGIRFADFTQLQWKNIVGGRLVYRMGKTDVMKNLKLMPQALEILDHYRSDEAKAHDFIFPLLDSSKDYSDIPYLFNQISSKNTLVNMNLKRLASTAEIEKVVSFHIARHSFSNIARRRTADLHSLKSLLGHSSIRITEQYLAGFDEETQDKTLETIFAPAQNEGGDITENSLIGQRAKAEPAPHTQVLSQ